jgi:hypothetical protein
MRRNGRATQGLTAAVVLTCLAAAAPAGAADRTTPERLLRAYPLEQAPSRVAQAPPRATAVPRPHAVADEPGFSQATSLLVAGAAVLLTALVVALTRSRATPAVAFDAAGALTGPPPPPWIPADPTPGPEDTPATGPDDARGPGPEDTPATAAAPAERGTTCQVRWCHEGEVSWFEAVTVGGRDRRFVAESPDFGWAGAAPPDREPEAQAALHALVDDLRDAGWSPVRGRGRQAGAPRWYARRFHSTTASHDDDTEET